MAYFGITALGAPNSFQAGLTSALGLNVFSNEEFRQAFKSERLTHSDIDDLLHDVYGFPPLEEEVKLFCEELPTAEGFDWPEFEKALERLRARTADFSKSAKEYDSYTKMMADRYKNIRMKGEL